MAEPTAEPDQTVYDGASFLWWLILLAALAAVLARALNPALPGVWVGVDYAITGLKVIAALSSQLFAVLAAAAGVSMVVATVRSGLPLLLKFTAGLAGPLIILSVMTASAVPLRPYWALGAGAASTVFALVVAGQALRFPELRMGALVLGSMAAAGALRMLGVASVHPEGVVAEQVLAGLVTVSFVIELLAVLVALYGLAINLAKRHGAFPRLAVAVLLVATTAGMGAALLGGGVEAGGGFLFVNRALDSLLTTPTPLLPYAVRLWCEWLAWLVLLAVAIRAPRRRLLWCAIGLSLVGRATPEQPLCGIALFLAALALVHDRGASDDELPLLERQADSLWQGRS